MRQHQLRIYKIKPGLLTEWVDRWTAEIVPARKEYGFDVIGAWVMPSTDEFIWLVAAGDSARSFEEREADYRASRAAVGAGVHEMNPLDYLAAQPDVRVVTPVLVDASDSREPRVDDPRRSEATD